MGAYTPNVPFRVRMNVDMTNKQWSAVIDDELNGFHDDEEVGEMTFTNDPERITSIDGVAASLMLLDPPGANDPGRIAYDDIAITRVTHSDPRYACYSYDTDIPVAMSFQSLLADAGFASQRIHLVNVGIMDLSIYEVILVGSDTSSLSQGEYTSAVAAIRDSGKPVIGLGEGGYQLFGQLGLHTGWPHGMHREENSIYVLNPAETVFNDPLPITIPEDRILRLYTQSDLVEIHMDPVPPDVHALGRDPRDGSTHYPLTLEGQRYLLWGFKAAPDQMLTAGQHLFVNAMKNLIAPPEVCAQVLVHIEDAPIGVPVNKLAPYSSEGPAPHTCVEIVTTVISETPPIGTVAVERTIPNDRFGAPATAGVRDTAGGELTEVNHQDNGGGRYQAATTLAQVTGEGGKPFYRRQIVWRFEMGEGSFSSEIVVSAQIPG